MTNDFLWPLHEFFIKLFKNNFILLLRNFHDNYIIFVLLHMIT